MEESFNVRVSKVFGSLPVAAASSSSLWCLTDEEIEKREWNRDKGTPVDDDEPKPYPKNLDGFANKSDKTVEVKPDGYDDEAWSIRSSIGKDCTLDNEEEEDEFDQVAIGREEEEEEEALDSLYQRDITDYETDVKSFKSDNKDPRANRRAAEIRLQEDAGMDDNADYKRACTAPNAQDGLNSILKSKGNHVDTKSKKRVRFDSSCKDECENNSQGSDVQASETSLVINSPVSVPKDSPNVPDYLRNPSKYKHYTFDPSPDFDDSSNDRAYADFLKSVKQPDQMESQDCHPFELPKSVTFTPKKKLGQNTVGINRNVSDQNQNKRLPTAMEAEDQLGDGICAMEEDEHQAAAAADERIKSSQKSGRRYRTKDSE